jgi:O-antigen ligase
MLKKVACIRQWLVTSLLLLFPVIVLVVHNAGNAIVFVLLVLSLLGLALRWNHDGPGFGSLFKSYWPLHLAMMSACIAVLCNQAWSGTFAFKYYDRAVRLAIFPLIFWLLFFVPVRYLRWLQWSLLAATVVATVKAYIFTDGGHVRDGNIGYLSIIAYSDITMLMGVMSLASIGWNNTRKRWLWWLKVLVCIAGTYTSVLTATRGGLLAIPLFVVFLIGTTQITQRQKAMYVWAIILALLLMFSFNDAARNRLLSTQSDLATYSQESGKKTSTGIRLQLWSVALKLFISEPVFGIGRENYEPMVAEMARKKEVSEELTSLAHSHNEILFNMAISGVLGLISTLAIYLVPGYFFARELKHPSAKVRAAGRMGCLLVMGFFAFGLTDLMFFWSTLGGYYSLMIAALLVYIIKEKCLPIAQS